MIQSKKINMIVAIFVAFALIISIAFVIIANIQNSESNLKSQMQYESKVFGNDIISIEIIADEKDWQEMLENAIDEEYIMVDVIVNGKKFQNVGIRPKGNSSLSHVINSDSDRYSFRLKFDEYIKNQTCFGLESFVINNMMTDNTYMKEYVSYELMEEIGVDAPLFGYTNIKVNGENWGLYLAVELYNESYEQRVFGDTSGLLYNVKKASKDLGDINLNMDANPEMNPEMNPNRKPNANNNDSRQKVSTKDRNNSSGGSLEYIDDNIESYSSIFLNEVEKGTKIDYQRVIEALKALSEGEELETYFDIDQILRYLAAHTIVVNLDSYSSNMTQNYYIYENYGQITILPWDYNQAWGGFQNNSELSIVNFPIDTPVNGVEMSSRPLIEKLLSNVEYLNQYHSYLQELLDEYFANGKFEEKIKAIDGLISDYVESDPTTFCSYEEYKKSIPNFITLGNLRAESIQGQLDGTVPSTTIDQTENPDKLVQTENLNLSSLSGTMGGSNRANIPANPPINRDHKDNHIRGENIGKRKLPNNNQDKGPENKSNLNIDTVEQKDNKSFILITILMLVLTLGLLFVWKFERRY